MKYIAALDVGTTTVRCHILDEQARCVASAIEKVELFYPKPGYVEIDPDGLWNIIVKVIRDSMKASGVEPRSITCLGISTQRCSFVSWNVKTGHYYHRFITWKDLRAEGMVKEWNNSVTMKALRAGAHMLYMLTRCNRFLAGSVFKFMNTQVTLRLLWALQHISELQEDALHGRAVFGGVDCWLLYKLTGKHVTDVSSASATGLFDPFTMRWADWAMNILKLPRSMFPDVVDTAGDFGKTPAHLFGVEVPILCSMADQAASLFGSGCFNPGDLKVTMGTGTFVNVNSGTQPHASVTGLYPVIGWRVKNELVYIVEGASNDTGASIEWIKKLGIVDDPQETSGLARSVQNSDGVYFVPAFSGLQAPINDQLAAAGFLGIKPTTERAHIIRSLLESLVFRIVLLFRSLCNETNFTYTKIRVDGGVSKNDFVMQLLADLTGLPVERPTSSEMSILGVAFLAGLHCGIWRSKEELSRLRGVEKIFEPTEDSRLHYRETINEWMRAVDRFKKWY